MDCPNCSKSYPDNAPECPHCAAIGRNPGLGSMKDVESSDSAVTIGNTQPERKKKERPAPEPESTGDNLLESVDNSWDSFASQFNRAKLDKDSEDSAGITEQERSFKLPPQATLTSSRAMPSPDEGSDDDLEDLLDDGLMPPPAPKKVSPWAPRSNKSDSKAFGRSAEVQEAPLHDSWSSGSGDSTPPATGGSWDGLASPPEDSLHDSWSAKKSSQGQERRARKSTWAAALQAAASEQTDDSNQFDTELAQSLETPGPVAIEDIPEGEPAVLSEKLRSLPSKTLEPNQKKGGRIFFRLMTILIVLLGIGSLTTVSFNYFTNKTALAGDSETPALNDLLEDDAALWLASAKESLDSNDFKLAVPQLESAISLLKKGEGKRGQLRETQLLLAKLYSKTGDHSASARLWSELAKSYPDLKKRGKDAAAAALRENRIIANQKVKVGEKAVKNKEFEKAIKVAKDALKIYKTSQGQNAQVARVYGVLGDAYRGEQNTRVAYHYFTEASKLDPEGRYLHERSKLKLPVRKKPRKKPKRIKTQFVLPTEAPQADANR